MFTERRHKPTNKKKQKKTTKRHRIYKGVDNEMGFSIFTGGSNVNFTSSSQQTARDTATTPATQTTKTENLFCQPHGNEWPTFWGPEIFCYNNEISEISKNSTDLFKNISQVFESFKCDLFMTSFDKNLEAIFHCAPSLLSELINSTNSLVSECVYNTTVIVKNVLNPVSELTIVLPKIFPSSDSGEVFCENLNQILRCDTNGNSTSFYENEIYDLFNSTSLDPLQCLLSLNSLNDLLPYSNENSTTVRNYDWTFLFVFIFIFAGGLGNILVCLAVALDRKLQNVTNYFLLSLAIADLLVSLFVMPLGAIPGFLGKNYSFNLI